MEPIMTKRPMKQLGELLQEHQEPFVLDVYLSERRYAKNRLNSGNSGKFMKISSSLGLDKSKKGAQHLAKIVKAIYVKLVSINGKEKSKDFDSEVSRNSQEIVELERFSSAGRSTEINSCCDSGEKEEASSISTRKNHTSSVFYSVQAPPLQPCNLKQKEACADKKLLRICMKQNEENLITRPFPEENSFRYRLNLSKKATEDSILSATLRELLISSTETSTSSHHQILISKMVLQQTKQLLFDCVREVVEAHTKRERALGSEEIRRLILEKVKAWGKSGTESNIYDLLNLDFLDSAEEWNVFETQKWDIGLEIGEAILIDIINGIITETADFIDRRVNVELIV